MRLCLFFCLILTITASAQQSMLELASGKHRIYHSVADGLVHPDSVVILTLRQITLTALPESVGKFKNLRFINLMKNTLETLPESFFTLTEMREITIRENKISALNPNIGNLRKLVF
jgi:Leucine-rich repeat (LRR) protein